MLTNREVFDKIASSWYGYRHHTRFRSQLESLAKRWAGGRLLNAGCGHGPDFIPFKERFALYGIDFSTSMIVQAKKYAAKYTLEVNLTVADLRALPFCDGAFDCSIAIASYHHLKGGDARLSALRELRRVLKPGAEAFITVWNRWQPRFWFSPKEVSVPWRTKDVTYQRYYYLFSRSEMIKLLKEARFVVVPFAGESAEKYVLSAFTRNICLLVKAV
jgi:tRNA (uracil-5-)-methyltransferase TRM9